MCEVCMWGVIISIRVGFEELRRPGDRMSLKRTELDGRSGECCVKRAMLCVLAAAAMFGSGLRAQDLTGTWQGTLVATAPDPGIRTLVKFAKDAKGGWTGTMYRVDQPGWVAAFTLISVQGKVLSFAIAPQDVTYTGKLSADGGLVTGTWAHGPATHVLNLLHVGADTAWEIPTPPAPPKPMAADADPAFDVATIKPNNSDGKSLQQLTVNGRNFRIRNGSLGDLIGFAYNVQMRQIVGGPDWMNADRYDIDAVPDKEGSPDAEQVRVMMRKLLAERFALNSHPEKREMSAFVLTVGKDGPKLTATAGDGTLPGFGIGPADGGVKLHVANATMDEFSSFLQMLVLDRPVVNQTALGGRYEFNVTFLPDDSMFNGHPPKVPTETSSAPALLDAMPQVGLKMTAEKTQVDVVSIDHVEKPSAN
jgi:uncharacterized protein (TIGR03435 family)